jgi:hypothetical protein
MASLETFGKHDITLRTMHLLEIDSLEDWPDDLDLDSEHFVLFLACDATELDDDEIESFSARAMDQGMVYLSTWGPDAERVHDLFDEVDGEQNPDSTADSVVLSEWHEDEPLADALRFAVGTATSAHDYEATCGATLCVSVGNPDWADLLRGWLQEPETLEEAIEDQDLEDDFDLGEDGEERLDRDEDDADDDFDDD